MASRSEQVRMMVNQNFQEVATKTENSLGDILRSYTAIYGFVLLGILALILSPFVTLYLSPEFLPDVVIPLATIETAIAFHLFSVGNTVQSIAASRNDLDLFETGSEISGNATIVAFASGSLFLVGIGWRLSYPNIPIIEKGHIAAIIILISSLLFLLAVLLHCDKHTWFIDLRKEMEEDKSKTS